jgi:hypothetical protein
VTLDYLVMPINVKHQAKRLLDLIQNAESMTQAKRHGAVAEGFLLGISTFEVMDPAILERIDIVFGQATDLRLVELSR